MKNKRIVSAGILSGVFLLRWQILQLIAWATMLARYSWTHGVRDGWAMTFDGSHPCAICHAVASGTQAEAWFFGMLSSTPSLLLVPAACLLAIPLIVQPFRRKICES